MPLLERPSMKSQMKAIVVAPRKRGDGINQPYNVLKIYTLALIPLIYLIFYPLEVVSRCRDTQLHVGENYPYLFLLKSSFRS